MGSVQRYTGTSPPVECPGADGLGFLGGLKANDLDFLGSPPLLPNQALLAAESGWLEIGSGLVSYQGGKSSPRRYRLQKQLGENREAQG